MRQSFFIFPHSIQLSGWGAAPTTLFSLGPVLARLVVQAGLLPLEMFAECFLLDERLGLWHFL